MKKHHESIGEVCLLSFKLEGEWTKEQLSQKLMDEIAAYAGGSQELSKGMDKFYLKIKGYRDENIIPEEEYCYACPRRSSYRKYDDYSQLRATKQPVLVLTSDYVDFKDYEIMCSYYTDVATSGDDKYDNNIEIWADKSDFFKWFKKKTGFRA